MTAGSLSEPASRSRRDYGNLRKKYMSYLLPAAITEVAFSLNSFVDGIVVANLLDSYALSMINLAVPVGFVFNTVSVLFGRGGSTLYSICREHRVPMSRAMLAAVSVEEMIVITSQAAADGKSVPMDVLIHENPCGIIIDFLSIGEPFNPTAGREDGEIDSFEMLRRLSRSVAYDYVLGMNTTRIVIAQASGSGFSLS